MKFESHLYLKWLLSYGNLCISRNKNEYFMIKAPKFIDNDMFK